MVIEYNISFLISSEKKHGRLAINCCLYADCTSTKNIGMKYNLPCREINYD